MKKLLYILLMGVFMASCSKVNPLVPSSEDTSPELNMIKISDITDPNKEKNHDGDGEAITDPDKEDDHDKEKKNVNTAD